MLLVLLAGCPEPAPPEKHAEDDTAAEDSGTVPVDTASCVEAPLPPDAKQAPGEPVPARVLDGTVTWTLSFDEAAEAAGFVDCDYTRTYTGVTELGDRDWLCPDCELQAAGTAVVVEGYEDCYAQISDTEQERTEHIGVGTVDGASHFFRSGSENVTLADMGAIVEGEPFGVAWESETELDGGGVMLLSAAGSFTTSTSADVLLEDGTGARTEPYACGWPMNNPGGPVEDWSLADGDVFPNARLEDQCGEPVDLWDFRGFYLVVDASSPDCGPCQAMAEAAPAFEAAMADACAPVMLVTLLNESLSGVNAPADLAMRQAWAEEFALESPVLADLGFGYALFPDYVGTESGMSLPSIVVVDPDGRVLYGSSGFSSYDEISSVILADFAARGD
jgi:hypothetical protein